MEVVHCPLIFRMKPINIIFKKNPLSTQTIYRSACRGRFPTMYMTEKGKEMKIFYQKSAKKQFKGKVSEDICEVNVNLFFKDKRKHDVDNFNKLILDSLQGIVYKDDNQIRRLTVEKEISTENPRVELEIIFI